MLFFAKVLGFAVILSVIIRCYVRRPYVAVVDDIDYSSSTSPEGEPHETVIISYSSSGNKYGKIRLPKSTFEKHLPDLESGDRILKYRGHAVPRLLKRGNARVR